MNMRIISVTALCLAIGLTAFAAAIDIPLTYERYADGNPKPDEFRAWGGAPQSDASSGSLEGWKLPQTSGKQVPKLINFAGKQQLFVLAQEKETDKYYTRLYFDANGNRDLTDDPVIAPSGGSDADQRMVTFPAVDIKINVNGVELPYSFSVMAHDNGSDNSGMGACFHFNVNCCYHGEFTLGGLKYRTVLGDADADGQFGQSNSRDTFFLTAEPKLTYYDGAAWSEHLWLNGQLYAARVAPDYSKMTLEPVTDGVAAMRLGKHAGLERVELQTADGNHHVLLYRPGARVQVPEGNYRLATYQFQRKDAQGDVWCLQGGFRDKATPVTAGGKKRAKLVFGEPFTANVAREMRGNQPAGSRQPVNLSFSLKGKGGDEVYGLTHLAGAATKCALSKDAPDRPKEPHYEILSEDGKVVAQGDFRYG